MWGSRLLRDRTPTRHRELLQFAPWCVRSSPSGLPFFSVSASHHLLFSGSSTDFSHQDREFEPASIRLLLFAATVCPRPAQQLSESRVSACIRRVPFRRNLTAD